MPNNYNHNRPLFRRRRNNAKFFRDPSRFRGDRVTSENQGQTLEASSKVFTSDLTMENWIEKCAKHLNISELDSIIECGGIRFRYTHEMHSPEDVIRILEDRGLMLEFAIEDEGDSESWDNKVGEERDPL